MTSAAPHPAGQPDSSPNRPTGAGHPQQVTELLYNLAALGLVAAFAYFFFWGFVAVVGPALTISIVLMLVERSVP